MSDEKPLLKISDAAARLGWSTSKVYRLVRAGHIPGKHVGGLWYVVGFDAWLQQRDNAPVATSTKPVAESIEDLMPATRVFGIPAG